MGCAKTRLPISERSIVKMFLGFLVIAVSFPLREKRDSTLHIKGPTKRSTFRSKSISIVKLSLTLYYKSFLKIALIRKCDSQ
jgi:hypothetical protein